MADSTVNDTLDRFDSLQQKLAQLDAMLNMSYGCAGEAFRNMNDALQDNYLWACSTLATECVDLVCTLYQADFKGKSAYMKEQEASHA